MFSYVGYITVEKIVGNRRRIDAYIQSDIAQLHKEDVTGYTTQTVKNISGAVTNVDTGSRKKVPKSNAYEQLQGKVPDLYKYTFEVKLSI